MAKRKFEEDLPGNSNSSKIAPMRDTRRKRPEIEIIQPEPEERTHRRVGRAVRRKRTLTESIAQSIAGEASRNLMSHVVSEVLLPAAKETIQSMVETAIQMMLFGEAKPKSRERDRTRISYSDYYDKRERKARPTRGDKFDLADIYFRDGREADEVLRSLCDALEQYDAVTVADYFDMAGLEGATWAHHKFGWDDTCDLGRARCTHTRDGWAILLPPPIELD